jgi:hypothetical protein
MLAPSPPPECYICLEADAAAVAGLCACRDRAAHAACLARWVEASGRAECPACRKGFAGALGAALRAAAARAGEARALATLALAGGLVAAAGCVALARAEARADAVAIAGTFGAYYAAAPLLV